MIKKICCIKIFGRSLRNAGRAIRIVLGPAFTRRSSHSTQLTLDAAHTQYWLAVAPDLSISCFKLGNTNLTVAPLTLLYNINAGHEEVDIVNVAWWLDYFGRRTLDGCSLRSVLVRRSSRVSWPRHDATSWYKTKIQKRGGPQTKSINRLKKWQKMGRIQGVASDSHILVPRVNDSL